MAYVIVKHLTIIDPKRLTNPITSLLIGNKPCLLRQRSPSTTLVMMTSIISSYAHCPPRMCMGFRVYAPSFWNASMRFKIILYTLVTMATRSMYTCKVQLLSLCARVGCLYLQPACTSLGPFPLLRCRTWPSPNCTAHCNVTQLNCSVMDHALRHWWDCYNWV